MAPQKLILRKIKMKIRLPWDNSAYEIPYDKDVSIGRDRNNLLIVPGTYGDVGRKHAVIRRQGANWVISDLESTNGTYVNNVKIITETPISPGHKIRLAESLEIEVIE